MSPRGGAGRRPSGCPPGIIMIPKRVFQSGHQWLGLASVRLPFGTARRRTREPASPPTVARPPVLRGRRRGPAGSHIAVMGGGHRDTEGKRGTGLALRQGTRNRASVRLSRLGRCSGPPLFVRLLGARTPPALLGSTGEAANHLEPPTSPEHLFRIPSTSTERAATRPPSRFKGHPGDNRAGNGDRSLAASQAARTSAEPRGGPTRWRAIGSVRATGP